MKGVVKWLHKLRILIQEHINCTTTEVSTAHNDDTSDASVVKKLNKATDNAVNKV